MEYDWRAMRQAIEERKCTAKDEHLLWPKDAPPQPSLVRFMQQSHQKKRGSAAEFVYMANMEMVIPVGSFLSRTCSEKAMREPRAFSGSATASQNSDHRTTD